MVSQPASTSRDRLLAAAAEEFAARGYDGARVDRIAQRARVNKAMVYYHFASKAALYRTVLVDVFQALAASVARASEQSGAEAQLRAFIRAIAGGTATHPHFPSMWLRELADGGRHLDATVVKQLGAILQTLAGILETGRTERRFRAAHPLVIQMGIVAPLLLFQASAPARARLGRAVPGRLPPVDRETFLAHLEATTIAALRVDTATKTLPSPQEKRR
jgi:TetR/AcrR family transcriptional regulator